MERAPSPRRHAFIAPLLLCAATLAAASGCRPPAAPAAAKESPAAPSESPLPNDLAAAFSGAERAAQGFLGVAMIHVESGQRASFHGADHFPMQSVFKLPLAIEVLARVDAGELRLDEMLTIRSIDIRPGPDNSLADELPAEGGSRSVQSLLERALITSDNTAADVLLERLGGPQKVTARLRKLGITDIDVSRSEAELMMDLSGVTARPPRDTWTRERINEATRTSAAVQTKALAAYLADRRDTATPTAMAALLLRVHRQDLLAPPSAALLVSILERVTSGKDRLKALLPAGTVIAHKTGTSGDTDGITAATNDVGIITLPGGAGHVIVAAFLSGARGDSAARAHALAVVGRSVFDHYLSR